VARLFSSAKTRQRESVWYLICSTDRENKNPRTTSNLPAWIVVSSKE
jgi:hypothetical protein